MKLLQKKTNNERLKAFRNQLTERYFLRNIRLSKKAMLELLAEEDWRIHLNQLLDSDVFSFKAVLSVSENILNKVSPLLEQGSPYLKYFR